MSDYGNFREIVDKELTVKNILKMVPEETLWRHYIGSSFQLNKSFSAPYREDKNPSFSIKLDYRDRLMFADFGKGEYGDIINYIRMVYSESFPHALERINYDFKLELGNNPAYIPSKSKAITKTNLKQYDRFSRDFAKDKSSSVKIQIAPRKYEDSDLEYWNSYGITKKTLDFYNVYCIKKLFLDGVLRYTHQTGEANPCYAYHFKKSDHIKCYFPKQQSQRFVSNVNNYEDIQGYYQCTGLKDLTKAKLLVLTKSMKDCMCLRELGYDAMAIHGEGHRFNEDFIRHIKKYYKWILSVYDMDETGVKGAKYLWKTYGIVPYFIPRKYRTKQCKDITDLRKLYGHAITEEFLKMIEDSVKSTTDKRFYDKRD